MRTHTVPEEEFRLCFEQHVDAVRRTAYLLCGDRHRAEDLTQSAFLKLYLRWNDLDEREQLTRYLRRIVTRAYLAERRRLWWRREQSTGTDAEVPSEGPGGEDRIVVWDALGALPPRQRAVLVLRYWTDLGVQETAEVLGCSPGTVKSQTSKGLATLKRRLNGQFSERAAPSRNQEVV
ncbi:SigE family RNA polymerase sigma factor [Umezawaea beigongshangensis]|uniref:SigE family RNA polymerase sigma factor n=1 Tax=Umezawaea beigongshangensis TaxID=2780383 RepID=UPI0018F25C11|nr:SigE family RNA polymerase sigma factor [Umezawaea beigongshangensis]